SCHDHATPDTARRAERGGSRTLVVRDPPRYRVRRLRACDLAHLEGLDDVAGPDVGVVRQRDAALEPLAHLGGVVLLAPERADARLGDDDTLAQQPGLGVAPDAASGDHATRDDAGPRAAEDL